MFAFGTAVPMQERKKLCYLLGSHAGKKYHLAAVRRIASLFITVVAGCIAQDIMCFCCVLSKRNPLTCRDSVTRGSIYLGLSAAKTLER